MKKIEIGRSGIQVPFLGLGTWAVGGGSWWGENDDEMSVKAIRRAVALGVEWIDTAPIYGLYHSEQIVGRAIRDIRHDVILSTKCALEWRHETPILHKIVDGTSVYRDLSRKSIIEDLEHSLMMLGTDYIDILFTHWQTTDFDLYPVEETVDALMTLKKQGKIRAVGASNVTEDIIREYCRYGQLDVIQEKYSILTRRAEKELLPVCRELGISIQAYSPLEQGLLTGSVSMDTVYAPGDVRNNNPWFETEKRRQAIALLAGWEDLCRKYNCTTGNLVIAATARMIDSLHVLCGARRVSQVEENVKALELVLEEQDFLRIKQDIENSI